MNTLQLLALRLFEDWVDADRPEANGFMSEAVDMVVPSITTVLFQMVVDDNALAFLDAPSDGSQPFDVLRGAICDEVVRLALELAAENEPTEVE